MFQALLNGQIDISDYLLFSSTQVSTFCSNQDLYCTSPQEELGWYGLEINSHTPFMGIPLYENRTTVSPSFVTTSTASGCSTGFGSLNISLRNQETSLSVLDSLNTITVSNQPSGTPSATTSDSGGSTPSGIYNIPCVLAGNYAIRSSVYNATGSTVVIVSATSTSGTLNVNWNSPSNVRPTRARALFGAAIAHLFDDPEFVSSFFGAVAGVPCAYANKVQGITCPTQAQIDNAECQFGNHPWLNIVGCQSGATGHDVSAYNVADDTISSASEWWNTGGTAVGVSLGYSGHDDLRAACDNFVSMGLTLSPSTATCNDVANAAAGAVDPGNYPHINPAGTGHIIDFIRHTIDGRNQWGQIIADTLDFLFGTPTNRSGQAGFNGVVCYGPCPQYTPKYYTFSQVTPCVFEDTTVPLPIECGQFPWQLYTGANGFDPFPDQFFLDRNSVESGSVCAGVTAIKPNNNVLWCDPESDTMSTAGEQAPTLSLSGQFFERNLLIEFNDAVDIPGNVFQDTFAENNGFNFQQCPSSGGSCVNTQSSIVDTLGIGTLAGGAYFTLLNARQVPGYNPCIVPAAPSNCASYAPGGGNPNLIRRGFSEDTVNVSPFTFNSIWEADILASVFDTMLQTAPSTSNANAQLIDWATTTHSSRFSQNEIGCNAIIGCSTGVTTQIWHLRNDLKFSDGHDVKATDVAYSIIAYRDVPSGSLQSFVLNVVDARGLDCGPGQPCKTLQVKIEGQGSLNELNIGTAPWIIEKSLWAPYCGDPPIPGGICSSATFDPMYPNSNSPGILVGTGPWACITPISGAGVSAGHDGGPCFETSGGVLTGGCVCGGTDETILLNENVNFQRCCPKDLPPGLYPGEPAGGVSATSSSLYKISYADFNNDGVVNILDLASIASAYGTSDPYWCNVNIACNGGVVGAVNLATVAIYFGHGITYPYTPQTLANVDPQIDPFNCSITGC